MDGQESTDPDVRTGGERRAPVVFESRFRMERNESTGIPNPEGIRIPMARRESICLLVNRFSGC